jgi:hypothetical protein
MKNLEIYNSLKTPPKEALKTIQAGRLKGMTDIKPQWRILAMTEQFGPCGIGWYTDNVEFNYQKTDGGEVVCNCRLNLHIKVDGEWSKPIFGTGGSKLVTQESTKLYVSDEAEKMAMTDALSVAMKALGVAGDIYLGYSDSKYEAPSQAPQATTKKPLMFETKDYNNCYSKLLEGAITLATIKQHYSLTAEVEKALKNASN